MRRNLEIPVNKRTRKDLARFASFPENNPDPIIETDSSGKIYYINPAAKKIFPDLEKFGKKHQFLTNLEAVFDYFRKNPKKYFSREIQIGKNWFHQQIYFVQDNQHIRVYGHDATQSKIYQAQNAKIAQLYVAISRVNEAIVRAKNEKSLFNKLCKIVSEIGDFPLVWVGKIVNLDVLPVAHYGPASDYLRDIKVKLKGKLSRGPTGSSIQKNREIINDDFNINPATLPWRNSALKYKFRASAAFPLCLQGKPVGALTLYASEPKFFDTEKIKLLRSLCSDVSYALDSFQQEQLRDKAEKELIESEKKLNKSQAIAHLGSWEYDIKTKDRYWSDETYRIYGYEPHSLVPTHKTFIEIVHPQDREMVDDAYYESSLKKGQDYAIEYRIIKKSTGEIRIVVDKCEHIKDSAGKIIRSIGMVQDITERKKAEDKLNKFLQAVEQSSASVVITDLNGLIEYVNQGFVDSTGYTRNEAMGKNPRMLKSEQTDPEVYKQLWKTITSGKKWEGELCNKKKNGDLYWEQVSISPVKNPEGKTTNFLAVKNDITDQKNLDQRKDDFITIAGHELRTPVSVIKITNQMLQDLLADNPEALRYLKKIENQATIQSNLINDLLNVSKIQAGKLEINKEQFDLQNLVKETVENMQKTTKKHKFTIEGQTHGTIFTDKDKIEQVLVNFCSNAIKYSPKAKRIIVKIEDNKKNFVIGVTDFGIGIPQKYHHRIFHRFYRVYGEGNTYPGLGMGLYISYQIIRLLGGKMWFESKQKKGSTFYFSLPIKN
jgi:PAS domain S-box-containing protein